MLEVLSIGDKVDIISAKSFIEEERQKVYISQIIDIQNNVCVKITMPTLGTTLVPLTPGQIYDCVFYTKKGLFQGMFEVIKRFKEGNLPVILLEIRTSLKKVQRREFYRFDCSLPLKYRIAYKNEKIPKEKLAELEWKDGVVLDLSGGGMRFVVPETIAKGDYLQFKLVLTVKDVYREFYLYGEIIHSKVKENNVRLHECRAQFVKILEADQELIISYIFTEERKKRNNSQ